MTELDAVNDILATVGEFPVDSLSDPNPLCASAQRILAQTLTREQARGWWFNRRKMTLEAGTTPTYPLRVELPTTALSVDPMWRHKDYVQRGTFLYDRTLGTYDIGESVECDVIEELPIDQLPVSASTYFTALACVRFSKAYDGDASKLRSLETEVQLARVPFHAEHIRNSDVNLYQSGSTGRALMLAYGQRYHVFGQYR